MEINPIGWRISMKTWTKATEINAPIEKVWNLFNGNLEDMQKIMPQVVENKPILLTEEKVGSRYLQKYREGKKIHEYEVITLAYEDQSTYKNLKIGFNLANMFDITANFELKSIDSTKTYFTYTTSNEPLKWFLKPLVKFGSDKVVVQFVERVKKVAELE